MNILPTIELPQYNLKVPSSGKNITYRPYLVKEEKILLMALESNDSTQIVDAINNIVLECTQGNIQLDDLTIFDVEYIFIKIRAKSVGETIEMEYYCTDENCKETTPVKVNFDNVEVVGLENNDMRYDLGNKLIIDLKYPSSNSRQTLEGVDDKDIIVTSVANMIKTIYYGDDIYDATNISLDEIVEFLGNLNITQFNPLIGAAISIPHINYDIEWKCKCGFENKISYTSLRDFFI